MPSSFHVESYLPIPADIFWQLRATPPFAEYLVSAGALSRLESTTPRLIPGHPPRYSRVQTYVPATMDIPDIIKPIIDDSYIEVSDTQSWDANLEDEFRQTFEVRPSILTDLVKTYGQLSIKPPPLQISLAEQSQHSCRHILSGECCVSIPFLGWYAEQAIISNIKTFHESYPKYIQGFVDMVVRRWGDGDPQSLREAVERMLAEEKTAE